LLHELNRDIWHPFRQAYGALDADAYLALHGADLIRVSGRSKEIFDLAGYAAQVQPWMADLRAGGRTVAIDFRFTERIVTGDLASESGVFELTVTRPDGDRRRMYGRFLTCSRRVEGRWRIVVDHDTDDGGTVDGDTYAAGRPLDEV
jgi:ketosteroid isomerase-like protein